jgi:protein-S-isoprenylcysteine O-methyltransferase Ste14
MSRFFRHLLAIAMLPFVVAVLIPAWIAERNGISLAPARAPVALAAQLTGVLLLLGGLWMFLGSLRRFATDGQGTLAPWDPPRQLVVRGWYRHVRNPMISGVLLILFGEALVLQSRPHLSWALLFLVINAIYIPIIEESMLVRRFGEPYRQYCRQVPRLLPRLWAWHPPEHDTPGPDA